MAIDWGLYTALRGTDNWAQRRQDKAINLQLVNQMQQQEQQKVQQSMLAEQEINKYFDEITGVQSEFLEQDQERIKGVEKQARQRIIKGIAQYNGDLSRYISSGGISDLGEYKNSIMQSEELKKAQMNKVSFGAILKDYQSGDKYLRKVEIDKPALDENGEPKVGPNGEPVFQREKVTPEEALKLFKDGVIKELPYNGSENKVKINPMTFKQQFKDPKNPYSRDNIVTASNVKFTAMQMGASEEYADELAQSYVKMYEAGGEAWRFNAISDEERQMEELKKENLKQSVNKKSSSRGGGDGGQKVLNQTFPMLNSLGSNGKSSTAVMGNKEKEFFGDLLGLKYDNDLGKLRPTKDLIGYDAIHKEESFDLGNALSVDFRGDYVSVPNKEMGIDKPGSQPYIVANVIYNADEPGKNNPNSENLISWNKYKDDKFRNNWTFQSPESSGLKKTDDVSEVVSGTVLIPISKFTTSQNVQDEFNVFMGIRSNLDGAARSVTNDDYYRYFGAEIQRLQQIYDGTEEEILNMILEQQQGQ